MIPVIGPVTKTVLSGGTSNSRAIVRSTYKQKKPYDLLLPYRLTDKRVHTYLVGTPPLAWQFGGSQLSPLDRDTDGDIYYGVIAGAETDAVNDAMKRFSKGLGDKAALGVALAQRQQSVSMIGKRAKQLFYLARALKGFKLGEAAKVLGLSPSLAEKRHRSWVRSGKGGPYSSTGVNIWDPTFKKNMNRRDRARSFANLWLEFSFGWMPSIDDVRSAVKVISNGPAKPTSLKTRGQSSFNFKNEGIVYDPAYRYVNSSVHKGKVFCVVGGTVTVTNEDLSLVSKLGLTSLGAIIYEVTPFSFIANYFVNIEEWLSQFSQYEGVTVSQAWYTIRWEDNLAVTTYRNARDGQEQIGPSVLTKGYSMTGIDVKRFIGSLPVTRLAVRPVYHNGIKRALNNVALLTQLFIKGRK